MSLLTKMNDEQAVLNNMLNIVYYSLKNEKFSDYLIASGLEAPSKVSKGYPTTSEYNSNQIFVNTSSFDEDLTYDIEQGVTEVTCIVDFFIADDKLSYIWKYQDAIRQWLQQLKVDLELVQMYGRTYAKADGAVANHFTLELVALADILNDETNPLLTD